MADVSLSSWALWVAGIVLFQCVVGNTRSPIDNAKQQQQVAVFPLRDALHLQRKAQHALTGLLFIAASHVLPMRIATPLLFVLAALFLGIHAMRKMNARVDALYLTSFRGILRRDEAAKRVLPGAFYFVLGTALSATLFSLSVARLAVLHLSIGDPAASLCGTLYRHHATNRSTKKPSKSDRRVGIAIFSQHKSLAGVLGAFVASTLASFVALSFSADSDPSTNFTATLCIKALFAGAVAAMAEVVTVLDWDDNLTLPLLSGLFLQLGASAFGFQY